jgi:hypothetical protein
MLMAMPKRLVTTPKSSKSEREREREKNSPLSDNCKFVLLTRAPKNGKAFVCGSFNKLSRGESGGDVTGELEKLESSSG